jgi:hypothetical protein
MDIFFTKVNKEKNISTSTQITHAQFDESTIIKCIKKTKLSILLH